MTKTVARRIDSSLMSSFPSARNYFANPKGRRDHIMVFSHGWGTIYAPSNISDRVLAVTQISNGNRHGRAFGVETIVLPPESWHMGRAKQPLLHGIEEWTFGFRELFAFFAGNCQRAHSVRIDFCNTFRRLSGSRPDLLPTPPSVLLPEALWIHDSEISKWMRRSTFCLLPRGWTPTTSRLFDGGMHPCFNWRAW